VLVLLSTHVFTTHNSKSQSTSCFSIFSVISNRIPVVWTIVMSTQALSASVHATSPPVRISKAVNVHGKSIGNGIFAGRDYAAGVEITSISRPLVGSLDSQYVLDTCANCYVWTEGSSTGTRLYVPVGTKVQKCAGCQRFRYCSKVRIMHPRSLKLLMYQ